MSAGSPLELSMEPAQAPSDFAGEAGRALRPVLWPSGWARLLPWWAASVGFAGLGLSLTDALGLTALPWRLGAVALALSISTHHEALAGPASLGRWIAASLGQCVCTLVWAVPLAAALIRVDVGGPWLQRDGWPGLIAWVLGGAAAIVLWLSSQVVISALTAGGSPRVVASALAQRRYDVVWLAMVGAASTAAAAAVALPVGLGLAWIVGGVWPRLGVWLSLATYSTPAGLGLLMVARGAGRLGTLLLASEASATPTRDRARVAAPTPPVPAARPVSKPTPIPLPSAGPLGTEALSLVHAIMNLSEHGDADLPGAIAQGEKLAAQSPRSAGVFHELAKLYLRAGRREQALQTAAHAISLGLNGGMSPVAINALLSFWEQREELVLDSGVWRQLGMVARAQGKPEAADWCDARSLR